MEGDAKMNKDLGKRYYSNRKFCLTDFEIDTLIFDHYDHLTMYISKKEGRVNYSAMISLNYMELDTILRTLGRIGYEIELLIAELLSSGEELPAIIDLRAKFKSAVYIDKCTLVTKLYCMSMSDKEEIIITGLKGSHSLFYCFVVNNIIEN